MFTWSIKRRVATDDSIAALSSGIDLPRTKTVADIGTRNGRYATAHIAHMRLLHL